MIDKKRPSPSGPGAPGPEDEALVERMAEGDPRAAGELFRRLSPAVYALAHRITGLPEDAEEVLVDSFHQAWSQARLYDPGRATVTGWLLNIARSRAIDLVRSRGRQLRRERAGGGTVPSPLDMPGSPEREAIRNEAGDRLHALLSRLPEDQRRVVELAYFAGLSHGEIAERLGQPLGTVKSRLRLALKKIRGLVRDVEGMG